MNIAIIGSGGDGAGMNECLYNLCKKLSKHNIILFNRGLQGIIENDILNLSLAEIKKHRTLGGIIIKSSRSADFLTEKGYQKFLKNIKNNKIDVLIVMGGNGSLQATRKIISSGIKCVFIPTTIDNDIKLSDYSMGFDTAIYNATDFINKVTISMKAFDRTCIYEVMGRHCEDLAKAVASNTNACYTFTANSTKTELLNAVKNDLKTNLAPIVILQENTVNIEELKKYLSQKLPKNDIKCEVVGYVQRGGYSTKKELTNAKLFALKTVEAINKQQFNSIICYNKNSNLFEIKSL